MNTPRDDSDSLNILREFRERLARGEALNAKGYAAERQIHATDELFVDLVFAEFLEREHRGDANAEEFILSNYPTCADELRLQIELHRSFHGEDSNSVLGDSTIRLIERSSKRRAPEQEMALPKIPGFDVLGQLGRGGMGVVLLARELELDRLVAIKLLLAGELSSADHRRRFRAEARSSSVATSEYRPSR